MLNLTYLIKTLSIKLRSYLPKWIYLKYRFIPYPFILFKWSNLRIILTYRLNSNLYPTLATVNLCPFRNLLSRFIHYVSPLIYQIKICIWITCKIRLWLHSNSSNGVCLSWDLLSFCMLRSVLYQKFIDYSDYHYVLCMFCGCYASCYEYLRL